MNRGALQATYDPWSRKELDMAEQLNAHSKQYYIKTHKILWSWEIDMAYMSLGFIIIL